MILNMWPHHMLESYRHWFLSLVPCCPCPAFTYRVGFSLHLPNFFHTLIPFNGLLLWVMTQMPRLNSVKKPFGLSLIFKILLLPTDTISKPSQRTLWVEYFLELRSLWAPLMTSSGRELSTLWQCLTSSRESLMPTWKAYTGTFVKWTLLYVKLQ